MRRRRRKRREEEEEKEEEDVVEGGKRMRMRMKKKQPAKHNTLLSDGLVHGDGNVEEVLEELVDEVAVNQVHLAQLHCDLQHPQAVAGHPAREVRLQRHTASPAVKGTCSLSHDMQKGHTAIPATHVKSHC